LLFYIREWDEWVLPSVRYQNLLFFRYGWHLAQKDMRIEHVAAESDQCREMMRITQAGFESHQASLGKAAQNRLFGWKSHLPLLIQ
jgi:hypothetical protein